MRSQSRALLAAACRYALLAILLLGLTGVDSLRSSAQEVTPTAESVVDETPTTDPTQEPTATLEPTQEPTVTLEPTQEPTATLEPTQEPTVTLEPTSTPEPAESPAETPAETPSPTPTIEATATTTSIASPTSTLTKAPTRTATSEVSASAVNGTARLKAVDKNGNLVRRVAFDIYKDKGNGALGDKITFIGDTNDDGFTFYTAAPGNYVAVGSPFYPHPGLGQPTNTRFTIVADTTKYYTVVFLPLSKLVISVKDATTSALVPGACFNLYPPETEPYVPQLGACDADDGAADGKVTVNNVDRYTYLIHQSNGIPDYFTAADRGYKVTTLNTTLQLTISIQMGGRIDYTVTFGGQPLAGSCSRIWTADTQGEPDQYAGGACDSDDGANDGKIAFRGLAADDYAVWLDPPSGYVKPGFKTAHVVLRQSTALSADVVKTGVLTIHIKNELNQPLTGGCFILSRFENDSYYDSTHLCDGGGGDADGTIEVANLQPANYAITQYGTVLGYVPIPPVFFTMTTADESIDAVFGVGAAIVIHLKDGNGDALPGGCFGVAGAIEGDPTMSVGSCDSWDGSNDGTTTMKGLRARSYEITQGTAPPKFGLAAPQSFTATGTETHTFEMVNLPYGKIVIHKKKPNQQFLAGACFASFLQVNGADSYPSFYACDSDDGSSDGIIEIEVPAGAHRLQEYAAPPGYVPAEDVFVQVTSNATTETTIVDPIQSTITVSAEEVWGDPVGGLCWSLQKTGVEGFNSACDWQDGLDDGKTHFDSLKSGEYTVTLSSEVPSGHQFQPLSRIQLEAMTDQTVMAVFNQGAPKLKLGTYINNVTTTTIELYFESNQPVHGLVEYGLTDALGNSASGLEAFSAEQPIIITGLQPGMTYFLRVHGENGNGEFTEEIFSLRTRVAGPTGTVEIRKLNASSQPLPGACFSVFVNAGSAALGRWVAGGCDDFDANPLDGKLTLSGLPPGNYVLVEDQAPDGFSLAKKRTFAIVAGTTKVLTVKDTAGGSTLYAIARDEKDKAIPGMCFEIYTRLSNNVVGEYVAGSCDDFDGLDGVTALRGLNKGKYYLWESFVVQGYIRGELTPFEFTSNRTSMELSIRTYSRKADSSVIARTKDSTGALLPGACFGLYGDAGSGKLGSFVDYACDGDDGRADGLTYFFGLNKNTKYVLLELTAPAGQQVGLKKAFTKGSKQNVFSITQKPGGHALKITNLQGTTSTKLKGACFGLYRLVSGQWQLVTLNCDSDDGANDGVTRIVAVPPGTYRVYETTVPAGYKQPAPTTVTIGTSDRSITVRTFK